MQTKVVQGGYRRYDVLEIDVTDQPTDKDFRRIDTAERIIVINTGNKPVNIYFNRQDQAKLPLNPGAELDMPLKTRRVFAVCPTVADTSTLLVIGFAE